MRNVSNRYISFRLKNNFCLFGKENTNQNKSRNITQLNLKEIESKMIQLIEYLSPMMFRMFEEQRQDRGYS